MEEIKVRKVWWQAWRKKLPKEGETIKITWLPNNNEQPNAYIGFKGVVKNVDKNGDFEIFSGHSTLIVSGNFNYLRNPPV